MNFEYYCKKIDDIKLKAPIESGVEILVYMLLDEIIENHDLSLVVIDSMQRKNRFWSEGGYSDLAVVTPNFRFVNNAGGCKGVIETKYISENLSNHMPQIIGQLLTFNNVLVTNGIDWRFYSIEKRSDDQAENEIDVEGMSEKRKEYNQKITEREAIKEKKDINDEIKSNTIEKINNEISSIVKEMSSMIKPLWEVNLKENDTMEQQKFIELITHLYQDWI